MGCYNCIACSDIDLTAVKDISLFSILHEGHNAGTGSNAILQVSCSLDVDEANWGQLYRAARGILNVRRLNQLGTFARMASSHPDPLVQEGLVMQRSSLVVSGPMV